MKYIAIGISTGQPAPKSSPFLLLHNSGSLAAVNVRVEFEPIKTMLLRVKSPDAVFPGETREIRHHYVTYWTAAGEQVRFGNFFEMVMADSMAQVASKQQDYIRVVRLRLHYEDSAGNVGVSLYEIGFGDSKSHGLRFIRDEFPVATQISNL